MRNCIKDYSIRKAENHLMYKIYNIPKIYDFVLRHYTLTYINSKTFEVNNKSWARYGGATACELSTWGAEIEVSVIFRYAEISRPV